MAKHRHPPKGDAVQLGGVRWARPEAYGSTIGRSFARTAAIAFAAAVVFGAGATAAQSRPKIAVPQARASVSSGAKIVRPGKPIRRARVSVARVRFTYCKWGGGTNCVVDGDTFWIGGQKVRIAGIDAPETHDYRCRSELELGERAARDLLALLNSGAVTMTPIDRDRDVYGRLLRNVSVNGRDVGEALISAGEARAYAGGRRPWC